MIKRTSILSQGLWDMRERVLRFYLSSALCSAIPNCHRFLHDALARNIIEKAYLKTRQPRIGY